MNWTEYFMEMSEFISKKSKDRSTKVGCVIVGPNHEVRTTGYNGFCRGIDDDIELRHERPEKYFWAEHAERNAIYNAARNGIRLEGCTLYSTVFPCADCARAIIQSGIKTVVAPVYNNDTKISYESYDRAIAMLHETGVSIVQYKAAK